MNSRTIANGILRATGILVGIALLAYFLYAIRSVLAYLAIATVIALLGRPVVLFLRRRLKFPNTLAVIATMVFMLSIFLGILALFIPLISEQSKNLSLLDIEALKADINTLYLQILDYFGATTGNVSDLIEFPLYLAARRVLQLEGTTLIESILSGAFAPMASWSLASVEYS